VLVIRDTRESGEMLEAALAAGVSAAGGEVLLGGVLPTPAAPLLIAKYELDLAAVISRRTTRTATTASSSSAATASSSATRPRRHRAPARRARAHRRADRAASARCTARRRTTCAACTSASPSLDLSGRKVLLDCANGATAHVAPEIFRRLNADVTVIADQPDGRNINDGVGSTHVDALARASTATTSAFAFDGDGDRVLAVDRTGAVVDGDELLALAVLHRRVPGVAVTVMTNFGFHAAMREAGIEVATTKVGDRYVLEELRSRGWALGGEQSGHLIDMGFVPSGDGIAAALLTLEALQGGDLADRTAMEKLPQVLVNVQVADRDAAMDSTELSEAVATESAALEGRGRVLVRPSGTEQLVRVMVEAPTADEADAVCGRLVAVVEQASARA
jgi:phosphoglucosamine mutase